MLFIVKIQPSNIHCGIIHYLNILDISIKLGTVVFNFPKRPVPENTPLLLIGYTGLLLSQVMMNQHSSRQEHAIKFLLKCVVVTQKEMPVFWYTLKPFDLPPHLDTIFPQITYQS